MYNIKNYPVLFVNLLFLIIALTLFACNTKKNSVGNDDEINIIADTADYLLLKPVISKVFNKTIYTPQPEKLYDLNRFSFEKLDKLKNKKNIIIACPLNTGSDLSKYLESLLDKNVKQKILADSVSFFIKYNLWADDQIVLIVTGNSNKIIEYNLLKYGENLIYSFQKISDKRLFNSLYNENHEQKNIEAKFLNNYGWMIYVQADFLLALNKPEDNFVWLRRSPDTEMERWIFVHWIENANPLYLSADSIAVLRNKLTKKFYRTTDNKNWIEIVEDNKSFKEINFNGYYAIMTQGLWHFNDNSGGGPFINYTFYDEKTKRLYMLDGSVYAPKYYKKKLIHQMDVLLQSFMPEYKVEKSKKEDILDHLEK
ncbi:MAG: DUF4837 family protein [bacterium]